MNASSMGGQEKLLLALVGVLGLYAGYVGLGMSANRLACGGWETPETPLAPVGFFATGEMTAFGTDGGCAASALSLGIGLVVTVLVVAVIVVLIVFARIRYRQSDRYLIRDINRREGIAKRGEINEWMGPRTAKKTARQLRPALVKQEGKRKIGAGDASFHQGASKGIRCWTSMEESILLLGPPRSGKGRNVIVGQIIDAPGAVITTSSRADNYAMTRDLRATDGRPVALFDPQGLTGQETTLKWSPITGCEDPATANARATSLVGAAGLDENSNNSEWAGPAVTVMQSLLHAAALGHRTVDELMLWGTSPSEAKDAVKILEADARAAGGWAPSLQGVINEDAKMRANKWFGVSNAVKGLAVPTVRESLTPGSVEETFDIDKFIRESGTLYIVGTRTGGSSAGPFLIAMMDAITQRAREIAIRSDGNRLDPPLSLILDEIANISSAWPELEQLMSDGGGVGVVVTAVFQSLGQIESRWSREAAKTLFEAATVKIQLGGASDTEHLRTMEDLMGTREITRVSTSRQKDGSSTSDQIVDVSVVRKDEIRRLPFRWALVLFRKQRPIFMNLRDYKSRKDSKEIQASKKRYAESIGVDYRDDDQFTRSLDALAERGTRQNTQHMSQVEVSVDSLAQGAPVSQGAPSVEEMEDPTAEGAGVGAWQGIEYG